MMSNKVTYAEIIEALSRTTGFSKQKSEAFAKALIAEVKAELQETGKASITNFGSFKVKEVAERQGQNPQTGEPITIPAHKRVTFTPYKALREEVNAKYAHLESELIGEKKGKPATKSGAASAIFEEEKLPDPDLETDDVVKEEPKSFKRKEHARGNNTGLIMVAVLVLVIVGLASAWFLLRTDDPAQTAMNASAETEASSQNEITAKQEPVSEKKASPQNPELAGQTSSETAKDGNIYQVKEDEWYWVISRNAYGKAHFWPLIFEANFNRDTHPDSLETGTLLKIPALSGTSDNLTAEDYARLASGAALVSSAYENFGKLDKAKEYARYADKWNRNSQ
ncbi:MAG: HU family DNA-binding protein [Gracilimonas sp.]|uniref:HU family DNA-binding protein n=1 Tax=Gracilimonas sp. TaxID=1974203 RepID=UPI0037505B1E|nr:HU family DNA-binding protein [Gracilimonas sp.]